jgi:hypothetical protein
MNDELGRIWNQWWPKWKYYYFMCLEELREITKSLSKDNLSPKWDLSPGPPEQKQGFWIIMEV